MCGCVSVFVLVCVCLFVCVLVNTCVSIHVNVYMYTCVHTTYRLVCDITLLLCVHASTCILKYLFDVCCHILFCFVYTVSVSLCTVILFFCL